jgi:squalene synthase HpnC
LSAATAAAALRSRAAGGVLAADLVACAALARAHYENFAVGSLLLPRRLRLPLAAIYATVRIADDLADEGPGGAAAAADIDAWERSLERAVAGERADHFALRACAAVIRDHDLPLDDFRALFRAFRTDTVKHRYATFEELLGYCRDSANPVGRLVLALFGVRDFRLFEASDALCTGLQLVNHWQDVAVDARRGRIYLPLEDLTRFGVEPEAVLEGRDGPALRALLGFEAARARALLVRAGALVAATRGRLRLEVALFRHGGLAACEALGRAHYGVLAGPPRLTGRDRLRVLGRGLADLFRSPRPPTTEGFSP